MLRRSDSNSRPNVRPIAGVPDHRVSKKQTNERVNNVRTVTCQAYTQTMVFDKVDGGVVNSSIALAAARGIQKSTDSGKLNELGRSWSKSFMEHVGFVMTKDTV